jgi:hypothetical protein
MSKPEPLYLRWRSWDSRIRHHLPPLSPYSAVIQRLGAAMTITTTVETLRLVMARRTYVAVLDEAHGQERAGHPAASCTEIS